MDFPSEPNFTSPMGNWLRKLLRACIASRIKQGRGYSVKTSPLGTILEIEASSGGGGSGSSIIDAYKLVTMAANHITCRPYTDTGDATTPVPIAKPYYLRYSRSQVTVDTITINYTYDAIDSPNAQRVASSGFATQKEIIIPRYKVGDIIYAVRFPEGLSATDDLALESNTHLLDLNVDGRAWARKYNQT